MVVSTALTSSPMVVGTRNHRIPDPECTKFARTSAFAAASFTAPRLPNYRGIVCGGLCPSASTSRPPVTAKLFCLLGVLDLSCSACARALSGICLSSYNIWLVQV